MSVTITQIIEEVCLEYMVTKDQITTWRRQREIVAPRHIAHWLCVKLSDQSLPTIGRMMKRDHTTIIHARRKIDREIAAGTELGNQAVEMLRKIHEKYEQGDFRKTSWMQTASGKAFFPLDPRPSDIDIDDIAHALSNLCRYAGHTKHFYSVAQHSVLVSRALPDHLKLWGLLHDASEAYLVDIPAPLKPHLTGYREIEARVMRAVCTKFGLSLEMPKSVKRVDLAILADERDQLMTKPPRNWMLTEKPLGIVIDYWPPEKARAEFLREFHRLTESERAAA